MRVMVMVFVLASACVKSTAVVCDDGRICPDGLTCDVLNHQCVTDDQLQSCIGLQDGTDCLIGTELGFCSFEICVASVCGDGRATGTERCDDMDLGGTPTCRQLGWYSDAPVTCKRNCTIDESVCEAAGKCGDGEINAFEFCETSMTNIVQSCLEFGYDRGLITCTPFCQPDFSTCESFGFAPVGTGSATRMDGVWGTNANDVWFVGLGDALHWNGVEWKTHVVGVATETVMRAVWSTGPTDVWAVGEDGLAVHYDGTAWTKSIIDDNSLETIWGSARDHIFAGSVDGTIMRYDGSQWTDSVSNTTYGIQDIWGAAARDFYAVGQGNTGGDVHRFDGDDWNATSLSSQTLVSVHGRSATDVWLLTEGSSALGAAVYRKTTGAFVNVENLPWAVTTNEIHAVSDTRVMVAARPDVAIIDNGRVWRFEAPEIQRMWAAGPNDVWGITNSGAVRHFAGTAWLNNVNVGAGVDSISGVSDTAVFVVSNDNPSRMHRWDGEGWIEHPGPNEGANGIWAASETDVWAACADGIVRRFGGASWGAPMSTNTTNSLNEIFGLSTSDVWAVGDSSTIIHYNGSTWSQPHTVPLANVQLVSVWAASATKVYAGGFVPTATLVRAVLFEYSGGTTWTEVTLPTSPFIIFSIWGTAPDNVFATGFGQILHYNGTSWTSVPVGGQLSILAVHGASNEVYATGDGGTMFQYKGSRWIPMRTDSTNELRHLFVTPHHVFVGSTDGTNVLLKP